MSNLQNKYLLSEVVPTISDTLDNLREDLHTLKFEGVEGEYSHGSDYECRVDSLHDWARNIVQSEIWKAEARGASAAGIRAAIRLACQRAGWEPGWFLSLVEPDRWEDVV